MITKRGGCYKTSNQYLDQLDKKNLSHNNTKWHIENHTMGISKNTKTEKHTNHWDELKNQYKHFF
jgi:hypothetical protein